MAEHGQRVVIVHTAQHVRAALEAASEANTSITLQSAPGAVSYAGGLYLLNLFSQEKIRFPGTAAIFILDCGEAGAEAISAMQMGHRHIRSGAAEPLHAKLTDIARQCGAVVISAPYESIDLRAMRDAKAACKKWLEEKKAG